MDGSGNLVDEENDDVVEDVAVVACGGVGDRGGIGICCCCDCCCVGAPPDVGVVVDVGNLAIRMVSISFSRLLISSFCRLRSCNALLSNSPSTTRGCRAGGCDVGNSVVGKMNRS